MTPEMVVAIGRALGIVFLTGGMSAIGILLVIHHIAKENEDDDF